MMHVEVSEEETLLIAQSLLHVSREAECNSSACHRLKNPTGSRMWADRAVLLHEISGRWMHRHTEMRATHPMSPEMEHAKE